MPGLVVSSMILLVLADCVDRFVETVPMVTALVVGIVDTGMSITFIVVGDDFIVNGNSTVDLLLTVDDTVLTENGVEVVVVVNNDLVLVVVVVVSEKICYLTF